MKTLKEIKLDYVEEVYTKCKQDRQLSALVLDISDRGLRNYLKELGKIKSRVDHTRESAFPLNEERLRYLDSPEWP